MQEIYLEHIGATGVAEACPELVEGFGHIRPVLEVVKSLYNQKPRGFGSLQLGSF